MKATRTYLIAILVFFVSYFLLFSDISAQVQDSTRLMANFSSNRDSIKTVVKSPTGAMIRSVIVPGWGQWYNQKKFKALLIFGTETGLLANSIYLNQKYRASATDWDREFYINNRNLSTWWLVGTILFSVADAFVDAHLFNFDESIDLSTQIISPLINDRYPGIQLSFCISFKF